MEGRVTAVMGTDWCLIEFDDEETAGTMWRVRVQGDTNGVLPFALGDKVVLTKKEEKE
jgi:hypothetical protein